MSTAPLLDLFPALVKGPSATHDKARVFVFADRVRIYLARQFGYELIVDSALLKFERSTKAGIAHQVFTEEGTYEVSRSKAGCGCSNPLRSLGWRQARDEP